MTMRLAAILLALLAGLSQPLPAATSSGGPVRTSLTIEGARIEVDVSWLQDGGVVILKIVSTDPIAAEKRDDIAIAARKLLGKRPGCKTIVTEVGRLVATYKLTGWTKPFSGDDLTGKAKLDGASQSAP